MSRGLVLGLDGGGSKTLVALADRGGEVVALRRGPGLDPHGNARWREDLAGLVVDIARGQGSIERAVLGLSCHTESAAVSGEQLACARRLFTVPVDTLNDVHVAFEGALAGRAGVLALAGTGAMTWAGDGRGLHRRAGGWGDLVGDEGSGYWLGREALGETTRVLDGRSRADVFARTVLDAIGVGGPDLIDWIYHLENRRASIAALAVTVDGLAAAGDPVAQALVTRAADHLVEQVEAAWRSVGSSAPMVWSYAGSLFRSPRFMSAMVRRLGPPRAPDLPPVGGALLEAARRAGWQADATWRMRVSRSIADATRAGGAGALQQGWTA